MIFGSLAFSTPWLLSALIVLPLLWVLLRAVPPAPVRRLFPAVTLLLGLKDDDSVSDRTPWWLLLLRMLAIAAVIVGLAGPVLHPTQNHGSKSGPLLIVLDASWASARDWRERTAAIEGVLAEAGRNSRPVAVIQLTAPETPVFQSAQAWQERIVGMTPQPWEPSLDMTRTAVGALGDGEFETLWMSDGLARDTRQTLLSALVSHGPVTILENNISILGLAPPEFEDNVVRLTVHRAQADISRSLSIEAFGRDPLGTDRVLAELTVGVPKGAVSASDVLSLPAELRARITRFRIKGVDGAGAISLVDDSLRRREVALISGRENREGLELLSPLHYLQQALMPTADLLDGALNDVLPANPDVIVLADVATLSQSEEEALTTWIENGGLLLRFAGPALATSEISRRSEHPLMPVRLRAGGRTVGGAMSWGAPKFLAPFAKGSPFYGLIPPEDVQVRAQIIAQPDPALAERVIAQLTDGTPLVTRKRVGQGQVVLFHVTANAEWSSLPLSGLFVEMLGRLSVTSATAAPQASELAGTIWQPVQVLDGFGSLTDGAGLAGVPGENLVTGSLGPMLFPGVYSSDSRSFARNVIRKDATLSIATWPVGTTIRRLIQGTETPLGGWFLALALILLTADIVASLALTGRLVGARILPILLVLAILPEQGRASDETAVNATAEVVLAHILTGDRTLDDTAQAGLMGLSETLFFRTSIEPATPVGINIEADEIAYFPLLYWPITPSQPRPSTMAYDKLNRYLRNGGMILFDTRDADIAGFGAASPNGRKLQQLASGLDIPALEPVPTDHVLTRTFYLLQDFPGRHTSRDVWVEAAPKDAETIEGMPFRNLNDGVTPVVIGGNDWASAWAMDNRGNALFPVGRGFAGERQRELAYRFGVNLVMHVLTGNYKSDQVHVPALLERLGQ